MITERTAEQIRNSHPIRLRYRMFSDSNPMLLGIGDMAASIKQNRRPVSRDNFMWQIQEMISANIVSFWNLYKGVRDAITEQSFLDLYGSEALQSSLGLSSSERYYQLVGQDIARERDIKRRLDELLDLATVGGLPEALVRGVLYVVRGGQGFDEREFKMLKQLCDASKTLPNMSQSEYKNLVRVQHEILMLDEKRAMESLRYLLNNTTPAAEQEALSAIHTVIHSHGKFTAEEKRRLQNLETYFVSGAEIAKMSYTGE